MLANSSPSSAALASASHEPTGTVYGVLLNDPSALAALGAAVHAPPYKAPPQAPVLYLKPRNTRAASGGVTTAPADAPGLRLGACLGLVIGATARHVPAAQAWQHIAGWVLVADLCVPHTLFYRPSVRLIARDASCVVSAVVPHHPARHTPAAIEALPLSVWVGGTLVHSVNTKGMVRSPAQLLADVSEFMTLATGDVLLLGIKADAPLVRTGQSWAIDAPGFATIQGRVALDA